MKEKENLVADTLLRASIFDVHLGLDMLQWQPLGRKTQKYKPIRQQTPPSSQLESEVLLFFVTPPLAVLDPLSLHAGGNKYLILATNCLILSYKPQRS